MSSTTRRWRPSLGLVVATVLALVLSIPLAVLFFFNFYGNRLIQQTENALIAQAVILSVQFADAYERAGGNPNKGVLIPPEMRSEPGQRFEPIFARLTYAPATTLPPRADPWPAFRPADPIVAEIGQTLAGISVATQFRTLAGFRITDRFGRVIGGSGEIGYSLAHVPEVKAALSGIPTAVLRRRVLEDPAPPLWSISRRANIRVFFAMPVTYSDRVIGSVYLSRTPISIAQQAYIERKSLMRALAVTLLATGVVGIVFWRFITRPISDLMVQISRISQGDRSAILPLPHYGTKEIARLGNRFLDLAEALNRRADSVATYTAHVTHELKTPITSIVGAAELLTDPDTSMNADQRSRFLDNIHRDAERMAILLDRLRSLAAARDAPVEGTSHLPAAVALVAPGFANLRLITGGDDVALPISTESLTIILTHLARNAAEHGADQLDLTLAETPEGATLFVQDNGSGISPQNRAQIFEPFFTTRRDRGGTGMGLSIVETLVRAHGGTIRIDAGAMQTVFVIDFHTV